MCGRTKGGRETRYKRDFKKLIIFKAKEREKKEKKKQKKKQIISSFRWYFVAGLWNDESGRLIRAMESQRWNCASNRCAFRKCTRAREIWRSVSASSRRAGGDNSRSRRARRRDDRNATTRREARENARKSMGRTYGKTTLERSRPAPIILPPIRSFHSPLNIRDFRDIIIQ